MPTWPLIADSSTAPADDGGPVTRVAPGLRGLVLPFQRDQKIDFANGEGVEVLRSQIRQVLGTRAQSVAGGGEVPWRTAFGSRLHLLRHRPMTVGTLEIARSYILEAIAQWVPDVVVTNVEPIVVPPTTLVLRIKFMLRSNQLGGVEHDVEWPLLA